MLPKRDSMARLPKKSPSLPRKPRSRFSAEYGILLELLVELRLSAEVTQEQLARQIGKSQSHVSMWERREREISAIDVWKWCRAVGVDVSDFYKSFELRLKRLPKK